LPAIDLTGKHYAEVAFSHELNTAREESVINLLVLKLNVGMCMCLQGKHVTPPVPNRSLPDSSAPGEVVDGARLRVADTAFPPVSQKEHWGAGEETSRGVGVN